MSKEIEYAEVRVLVGRDYSGEWQADIADEDWDALNISDWSEAARPRRLILRVPIQKPQVAIITLPENPSDPVSVEVSV